MLYEPLFHLTWSASVRLCSLLKPERLFTGFNVHHGPPYGVIRTIQTLPRNLTNAGFMTEMADMELVVMADSLSYLEELDSAVQSVFLHAYLGNENTIIYRNESNITRTSTAWKLQVKFRVHAKRSVSS